MAKNFGRDIIEELKRLGVPFTIVRIKLRHEKAARKHVLEIEDAHKKAAKSTLRFKGHAREAVPLVYILNSVFCGRI